MVYDVAPFRTALTLWQTSYSELHTRMFVAAAGREGLPKQKRDDTQG